MTYSVEISNLDDSAADAVFRVVPPVEFINEEARKQFGSNVLGLIARRTGPDDVAGGILEITHHLDDKSASVGYAKIPRLRYGSGKQILEQALLIALNGGL